MAKVDPIERAEQQVATARTQLEEALEQGKDSTGSRADLDHALASLEAARAAAAQPAAAAPDTTLDDEADKMALEAAARIGSQISPLVAIDLPTVEVNVTAARDLIAAQRRAEQDQERQRSHEERVANVRARIAETQAKRQKIVDKRISGQADDDDAAAIRLIELDLQALNEMLARVLADRPTVTGVSAATVTWQQAQAQAEIRARTALIETLQAKLIEAASIEPRAPFGERVRVDPRLRELIQNGTVG